MTEFVTIPAGWFLMGSDRGRRGERPAHRVWVDAFDLAIYPVTRRQYTRFLEATGHAPPRDWDIPELDHPDLPVVGVSWHDATALCRWLGPNGQACDLPTEAEWERAARGGSEGAHYPWGDAIPEWVPNAGKGPLVAPWPVTLGEPNGYGLYGIGANIHEWCSDWLSPTYYAVSPAHNPKGPDEGTRRASRGGAWRHAITMSRCAARSGIDPSFRYNDYGFRVVRRHPAATDDVSRP